MRWSRPDFVVVDLQRAAVIAESNSVRRPAVLMLPDDGDTPFTIALVALEPGLAVPPDRRERPDLPALESCLADRFEVVFARLDRPDAVAAVLGDLDEPMPTRRLELLDREHAMPIVQQIMLDPDTRLGLAG